MSLLARHCSTLTDAVAVFKQPRWKTDAAVMAKMFSKGQIIGKRQLNHSGD